MTRHKGRSYFPGMWPRTFQLSKSFQKLLCIKCICKQRIRAFAFNLVEPISKIIFSHQIFYDRIRSKMRLQRFSYKETKNKRPTKPSSSSHSHRKLSPSHRPLTWKHRHQARYAGSFSTMPCKNLRLLNCLRFRMHRSSIDVYLNLVFIKPAISIGTTWKTKYVTKTKLNPLRVPDSSRARRQR
jgi:hypothetical protein